MARKRNNGIPFGSVVSDISRGVQLTSEQLQKCITDKDTGYKYLSLADISDDSLINLDTDSLRSFDPSETEKNVEQFCLKPNMLLLTKNDTPFKVQICGNDVNSKIVVGGNIYMITVNPQKVIPFWLCCWLQSEEGMARIRSAASLTNNGKMRWISKKQLEGVVIPDISFEQQANMLIERLNEQGKRLEKIADEFFKSCQEILSMLNSLGVDYPQLNVAQKNDK